MSDFDAPDSPPPPAYEFCQQEFDQKVSHALEASQRQANEDDEWEVWDEAAFEVAAARLVLSDPPVVGESSSSSSRSTGDASGSGLAVPASASAQPVPIRGNGNGKAKSDGSEYDDDAYEATQGVQPLRIAKKGTTSVQPELGREKERPSWFAEAQLGGPTQDAATPDTNQGAPLRRSDTMFSERLPTPPPEFTPVGPSLDGPPYDGPVTVLTYVPGDSRPASPLHSPIPVHAPLPSAPPRLSQSPSNRRSLPQPPQVDQRSFSASPAPPIRTHYHSLPAPARPSPPRTSPRPTTTYSAKPAYVAPRVAFDPRLAYASAQKSSYFDVARGTEPLPAKVNAASLYRYAYSPIY
jgi:hypothetical protein